MEKINEEVRENIYLSYCIINIPEAKNLEEELFSRGIYLPNLLRGVLSRNYFQRLDELGVFEDILPELSKSHFFGREESIVEFINWVDEHPEYDVLLDEVELKKLGDELEEFENNL